MRIKLFQRSCILLKCHAKLPTTYGSIESRFEWYGFHTLFFIRNFGFLSLKNLIKKPSNKAQIKNNFENMPTASVHPEWVFIKNRGVINKAASPLINLTLGMFCAYFNNSVWVTSQSSGITAESGSGCQICL